MNPLFDPAVFDAFSEGLGQEDALEALASFLDDTGATVAGLHAQDDRMRLKREIHAVKGLAATFGFEDLARLARELDAAVLTLEPARLAEDLAGLQRSFAAADEFARKTLLSQA